MIGVMGTCVLVIAACSASLVDLRRSMTPSGGEVGNVSPNRAVELGYVAASSGDDYVAWWAFGNGAQDATGAYNGLLKNGARIVADKEKGTVLDLHGSNGHVEVACNDPLDGGSEMTLAAWVKLESFTDSDIITGVVSHGDHQSPLYALGVGTDETVRFVIGNGGAQPSDNTPNISVIVPVLNTWHHLVGTCKGNVIRLYLDAVLVYSVRSSAVTAEGADALWLGKAVNGSSIDGQIDDVMIYRRALAQCEIVQLYEKQKPRTGSGSSPARTLQKVVAATMSTRVRQDGAVLQRLVDAAEPNGVVELPWGCFEVKDTITVPEGVCLAGSGLARTILCQYPSQKDTDYRHGLRINASGPQSRLRISGIAYVNVFPPTDTTLDKGIEIYDCKDFRVDNCYFEGFGSAAVWVEGDASGVVDHCVFVDNYKPAIGNIGDGVGVERNDAWDDHLQLGGAKAVFVEDCVFAGSRHAISSNAGAHYVFRHNLVEDNVVSHAIDAHGPGYGSERGTQCVEVYENVVRNPHHDPNAGPPGERDTDIGILIRGGGGVIFNNTFQSYIRPIQVVLEFGMPDELKSSYPWRDQVHDLWIWNNVGDTGPTTAEVNGYTPSPQYIRLNRDYFTRQKPGYTPFTYPHPLTRTE